MSAAELVQDGSMVWVGPLADWATILAAGIAVVGTVSYWLSRARVKVVAYVHEATPGDRRGPLSASVAVLHKKGAAPIRGLHYAAIGIDRDGGSVFGDWLNLLARELVVGESVRVEIYDPDETSWTGEPSTNVIRQPIRAELGLLLAFSWQHPTLPWRRAYCTVSWPLEARGTANPVTISYGRAARKRFEDAYWYGAEKSLRRRA